MFYSFSVAFFNTHKTTNFLQNIILNDFHIKLFSIWCFNFVSCDFFQNVCKTDKNFSIDCDDFSNFKIDVIFVCKLAYVVFCYSEKPNQLNSKTKSKILSDKFTFMEDTFLSQKLFFRLHFGVDWIDGKLNFRPKDVIKMDVTSGFHSFHE